MIASEDSTAGNTIMTSMQGRITWITCNKRYYCTCFESLIVAIEWRSEKAVRGVSKDDILRGTKEVRVNSKDRVRRTCQ